MAAVCTGAGRIVRDYREVYGVLAGFLEFLVSKTAEPGLSLI
jgi:hypothetical protein